MKILFIACYSPMINNSASIETLMYLNNLCNIENNDVHLLTVDFPKNSIYYDEEILKLLDSKVKVHAIEGGKLFNKIMPKKSIGVKEEDKSSNTKSSSKIKLMRKIKNKIIFPDMYYNWSFKASKYGIELMNKEKFDVIFSMHEPPSSHLCALRIKKHFKEIPWVLYWSDPWLKDPSREDIGFIRKFIEGRQEKSVVLNGDRHIFVTEENKEDFMEKYNVKEDKMFIVTRGYNKAIYEEIERAEKPELLKDNKINLIYAGEIFSKIRDLKPFIKALKELEKRDQELFNRLNIIFFGNIDDENIKEELKKFSNVSVNGRIDYKEALRYMIHGDVLLVLGNKNSKQIPAKIYDYLGTKNLIMVILGDENDPIKNVVTNKEKCIVSENNYEAIIDDLNKCRDLIDSGKKFKANEEYEWSSIGKKLNNILKLK
ncbi:glycosyl transferase group 1 [Clostridium perfringens]|uniref:glycosyltransferase n=1 Tax=Clostridium perfringens TaxID=1502 RepID=UPI00103927ED|nr:glycosyltransferase [Clostridium perfringens]ELC8398555.1 glycosyltransferase [Clostridium perfringens]TBX08771.1 glycosyl transferase group 1 [Clostridium perfringens]